MALKALLLTITFSMISSEDTQKQLEDSFYLRRRQNECIEETRVDPDIVTRIRNGNWKSSSSQEVKNWALCVLQKGGLMTKEGVYKLDVAMAKIPSAEQTHIVDLIDKCLSSKAIPAPDIAYKFMKCFQGTLSNRSELICGV